MATEYAADRFGDGLMVGGGPRRAGPSQQVIGGPHDGLGRVFADFLRDPAIRSRMTAMLDRPIQADRGLGAALFKENGLARLDDALLMRRG